MNKTVIIEFGLFDLLLKLWNVSKKMRQRLKWIAKGKFIRISGYNSNFLKLTDWVALNTNYNQIQDKDSLKQGICNYLVKTQEDLDTLQSLNKNQLICDLDLSEPIKQTYFEKVNNIFIKNTNLAFYATISFGKVKKVSLYNLTEYQAKSTLDRIDLIDDFTIYNSNLKTLDLCSKNTSSFKLFDGNVSERFSLCKKIPSLSVVGFNSLMLYTKGSGFIVDFDKEDDLTAEEFDWIANIKGLKEICLNMLLPEYLKRFPSSLRRIEDYSEEIIQFDPKEIKKRFPHLISLFAMIPLSAVEELKPREIEYLFEEEAIKLELTARPMKIAVIESNWEILTKHVELFEKVKEVYVDNDKFSLDCLPLGIKKVVVLRVNEESSVLIRLEGKCRQI